MEPASEESVLVAIARNILEAIGNTPLVPLRRLVDANCAMVLGKLEAANPSGSVKDRTVLAILEEAEAQGRLHQGDTIVEASAGNTAISLALIGAAKGYQVHLVFPESVSLERRRLLSRFGAQLRLTEAAAGMRRAQEEAQTLAAKRGHFLLGQFTSPASVRAHRETTAREILDATGGVVHAFVAGVGTGATITGVGERLKQECPGLLAVAVEPLRSPLLSKGWAGQHGIPGLGADFVPPLLKRELVDEVIAVSDEDAASTMRRLATQEGLMVGVSSGANAFAALQVAARLGRGKRVVTILPDTGERYVGLSL